MTEVRPRARKILKFHTITVVADALDVSDRTVRRWIKRGDLKAHQMGGVLRISYDELDDFVEAARQGLPDV